MPGYYQQKRAAEKEQGRKLTNQEFEENFLKIGEGGNLSDTGTSVFDPCLCEQQYIWYTNPGDHILDPFAGGSVRGIVAEQTGRKYTGIDLRAEQVEANRQQAAEICSTPPTWIVGDSLNIDEHVDGQAFDFIFTCPPYGDLEVYSDDARDLSNKDADDFDRDYTEVLLKAANHLKPDRFASIVVGNYRDRRGNLRDLCGLTIRAMEQAGMAYYNDAILVTPAGSLPIRIAKQFNGSRKIGRRHQYVLTFNKGDPVKAAKRLENIKRADLPQVKDYRRVIYFTKQDKAVLEYLDNHEDADRVIAQAVKEYIARSEQ